MADDEDEKFDDAQEEGETKVGRDGGEKGQQRTFYSETSAARFFQQYEEAMEVNHQLQMDAQERLIQQVNAPIVALTAKLDLLLDALGTNKRRSFQGASPRTSPQTTPPVGPPPPLGPPPLGPPLGPPPLGPPLGPPP